MRLEGIPRNTIRSLPFTSSSPADFPTLIHLHSSKEIQICQLLQLLYTLHICFHHLLIIEQYPLPFHPLPQMCDIMPQMYGRPLVRDEPKKFVLAWTSLQPGTIAMVIGRWPDAGVDSSPTSSGWLKSHSTVVFKGPVQSSLLTPRAVD